MTGTILQLRSHEVWQVLELLDPVATMAEYLIGRTFARTGHGRPSPGRLILWKGPDAGGAEVVRLDHPEATEPCVLPAQSLRGAQAAALAAVTAREMLVSGGVTMAMLGPIDHIQHSLSLVARHVPDISHVALHATDKKDVEPKLADQLDLSGIELSVVPTVAEAVFGANLVVVANRTASAPDLAGLRIGDLARGALLVNATGSDLPPDLVDQVDQVHVDDIGLLDQYPDRRLAASQLAEQPQEHTASTHHGAAPRIAGDLVELLTGQRSFRRGVDEIVLVELLGVHELNADLAYRIYEVATRIGLGVRIAS
jgi:ornithine cyclodeaminase/alanine dehydrogenase-like protein (mu-crystallin family)